MPPVFMSGDKVVMDTRPETEPWGEADLLSVAESGGGQGLKGRCRETRRGLPVGDEVPVSPTGRPLLVSRQRPFNP